MTIGSMRRKVEIQAYTRTSDGGGGASISWSKVASVWADIQPQGTREAMFGQANQNREVGTAKIMIRFRRGIAAKQRILHTYRRDGVEYTETYNIVGVADPDGRERYLELTCESGVPT